MFDINQVCTHLNEMASQQLRVVDGNIWINDYNERGPHIYFHTISYGAQRGRMTANFTYGYNYNQFLSWHNNGRPTSEISFAGDKDSLKIAKDIHRKLIIPCWEFFIEKVKPTKDSNDSYRQNNLERLTKIATLIGDKPPELGADRISGRYRPRSEGGYADDIRACSENTFDFKLSNVSEELTMKILRLVYEGTVNG